MSPATIEMILALVGELPQLAQLVLTVIAAAHGHKDPGAVASATVAAVQAAQAAPAK